MNILAAKRDKFSIAYSVWAAMLLLFFVYSGELDRIFNLWFALVPLLLVPAIIAMIVFTVALVSNARRRQWRRVLSIIAAPFAAYVLLFALSAAGVNPQTIRFELSEKYYRDQVVQLPPADQPRFKLFDWGQTGGAGVTNFIYTLIYDESDEIYLPAHERSKEWMSRAGKLCPGTVMCSILNPTQGFYPTEGSSIDVKKIKGHFYLLTVSFG